MLCFENHSHYPPVSLSICLMHLLPFITNFSPPRPVMTIPWFPFLLRPSPLPPPTRSVGILPSCLLRKGKPSHGDVLCFSTDLETFLRHDTPLPFPSSKEEKEENTLLLTQTKFFYCHPECLSLLLTQRKYNSGLSFPLLLHRSFWRDICNFKCFYQKWKRPKINYLKFHFQRLAKNQENWLKIIGRLKYLWSD